MTCGNCEASVKSSLSTLPGVQSVEVNRAAGMVKIEGSPDPQQVVSTLEELGFEASPSPASPLG
jgi:copper chaperone